MNYERSPRQESELEARLASFGASIIGAVERNDTIDPGSIQQQLDELASLARSQREQMSFDPLTGLFQQVLFKSEVLRSLVAQERVTKEVGHSLGYSILFLDIDDFKSINSRYGHQVGSLILKTVANRLTDSVRRSDACFRVGGDELVVVSYGASWERPSTELRQHSENLMDKVREPISVSSTDTVSIGVSGGLATFSGKIISETVGPILRRKDHAQSVSDILGSAGFDRQAVESALLKIPKPGERSEQLIGMGLLVANGLMYDGKKTTKNTLHDIKVPDVDDLRKQAAYYEEVLRIKD